jgi:hypothetical protein
MDHIKERKKEATIREGYSVLFGTFVAFADANAFAVRDLLGHRTLAMTGRCVERAADMVRATADAVSGRIAAALNAGTATPAEVVKFSGDSKQSLGRDRATARHARTPHRASLPTGDGHALSSIVNQPR